MSIKFFLSLTLLIFIQSKNSKTTYNFLVMSDIHENYDNLHKVIEKEKTGNYDFVILPGDQVNLPIGKNNDTETMKKYSLELNKMIKEIEVIAPVVWIPGNHEPANAFDTTKLNITFEGVNLHKQVLLIDDGLLIIGLGGNTPILTGGPYTKGYVPFSTLKYEDFKYAGYPYNVENDYVKSDEAYKKDLMEQINKAKTLGNNNQYILLTHNGPSYTTTNYEEENGEVLYLGSKNLGLAFEDENNFILNIHGHTHVGKGLVMFPGKKYVMNPGALTLGHYSKVTISKKDGKWFVEDIDFRDI